MNATKVFTKNICFLCFWTVKTLVRFLKVNLDFLESTWFLWNKVYLLGIFSHTFLADRKTTSWCLHWFYVTIEANRCTWFSFSFLRRRNTFKAMECISNTATNNRAIVVFPDIYNMVPQKIPFCPVPKSFCYKNRKD